MIAIVRQIFDVLLAGTNFITSSVLLLLNVSRIIGYFVVKYLLLVFKSLTDFLFTVISVFNVFYEDFCIFFADFSSKVADVFALVVTGTSAAYIAFKSSILAVKSYLWYIHETIINFAYFIVDSASKSLDLAVDLAELFKWSVIMIGRGFWIAIQLVPLCLLYLIYSIFSLCVYIITSTLDHIDNCLTFVIMKASLAGKWTKSYVFDFPLEAVFGLVLGTAVIYFSTKYRVRIGVSLSRSVRRTLRLMRTALLCLWLMCKQQVHNWLRRPTPHAPVTDSDSDSTQDEEPQPRRSLRIQSRSKLPIKESPETLKRQLELEQEEKLCVVCQDQFKCVIVMPCRHLCLCGDCSQIIQHTTHSCPICRQQFDRVLTVYM